MKEHLQIWQMVRWPFDLSVQDYTLYIINEKFVIFDSYQQKLLSCSMNTNKWMIVLCYMKIQMLLGFPHSVYEKLGSSLGQAQTLGNVKSVNGIPTLPYL
jgi:hypothetical protein